jgi:peptide/nickel transport system permease protein
MASYLARRVLVSIVILLGISLLIFGLLHAIPGSPGRAILGPKASREAVSAFDDAQGYNRPLLVQYGEYLNRLLHGNLGYSYHLNQPVRTLLASLAPKSAVLSGIALVLAIAVAVPLGIFQAIRRKSLLDHILTGGVFLGYSLPSYLIGLLLISLFSIYLHWLPSEAPQSNSVGQILAQPSGLILPVATLSIITIASFSRYMRSSMLDNLVQDYVRTARGKGLTERRILIRHVLRNSLLPVITLVGLSIPNLLAGNLITETVFNYNGLGLMFFNALGDLDYPVLLAYTLVGAVLTVLGNLMADIAVAIIDPRVRYAGK